MQPFILRVTFPIQMVSLIHKWCKNAFFLSDWSTLNSVHMKIELCVLLKKTKETKKIEKDGYLKLKKESL